MKVNHIISLAAFYSKTMQDMNISIALATPLRYLSFHQRKQPRQAHLRTVIRRTS